MRLAVHEACMGEKRNTYGVLECKIEGKRSHGKEKRRWGIILEWSLKERGGRAWIGFEPS
jgi:hypothetical protein